jgi:hypothetical protein
MAQYQRKANPSHTYGRRSLSGPAHGSDGVQFALPTPIAISAGSRPVITIPRQPTRNGERAMSSPSVGPRLTPKTARCRQCLYLEHRLLPKATFAGTPSPA